MAFVISQNIQRRYMIYICKRVRTNTFMGFIGINQSNASDMCGGCTTFPCEY